MELDEAIEILTKMMGTGSIDSSQKDNALKLGIEALKGIKKIRKVFRPYVEVLLPGETEG